MARYIDFRNNMTLHPNTGDLLTYTDEQAIANEIKNFCFTDRYERFWDPYNGVGIPQTLFENITEDSEYLLKVRISDGINKYIKRCILREVIVVAQPDLNGYHATIKFLPINSLVEQTVSGIIKRVR